MTAPESSFTRLRPWTASDGRSGARLYLWCPACEDLHAVEVQDPAKKWEWDGNLEAPTISPSILVSYPGVRGNHVVKSTDSRCHSYLKQGRWEFLSDCTHALAGQTADMVPLPDWIVKEGT